MFSKLLDPVDLTSHLIFFKIGPTVRLCFYNQNKPNILQNLFHAILNKPKNPKTAPPKKNLCWSKKGGGGGRYDRGQRFNGVFCMAITGFLYGHHWGNVTHDSAP